MAELLWAGIVYLFGGELVVLAIMVVELLVLLQLPESLAPKAAWAGLAVLTTAAVAIRLTILIRGMGGR